MLRVKCPHCGAGNQDATEKDTCWQCGNVLGMPVARPQTSGSVSPADRGVPTQQLDVNLLSNGTPSTRPTLPGPSPRLLITLLSLALFIVVVLVVLLFLSTHR